MSAYAVLGAPDAALWSNLERSDGQLHGRDDALDTLCALCMDALAGPLTLVGPPGVGKSRLVEALGWALMERGDGAEVWWVDLRELVSAEQVCQAVAELLGVPAGAEPVRVRLERVVVERSSLWILLDNAEHILAACGEVACWLVGLGAQVILTSREPLGVATERVFALDVLASPDSAASEEELRAQPAMALLVERVGGRREPGIEELRAQAQIIARFDGLPLALTLIAPRLRMIKPQALLAQLDAQDRASATRLPALDEALELSWELLAPWEREALAQCAVCADGFTLGLAQAVASLEAWPDAPPLEEVLAGLTRRSLLVWWPARGRWTMLLSVQRFAQRKLGSQEREEVMGRLIDAMSASGWALMEACGGSAWHPSVTESRHERANMAVAAEGARARGQLREWLRCSLGLGLLLWRAGEMRLQGVLAPLLDAVDADGGAVLSEEERALLWRLAINIAAIQWSVELERPWLERALALGSQLPQRLYVTLLWNKADALLEVAAFDDAAAQLAFIDTILNDFKDDYIHARQRFMYGNMWMQRGQYEQAASALEAALAMWPGDAHPYDLGRVQLFYSFTLQSIGEATRALEYMGAARHRFAQVGDHVSQAHALRIYANYCVDEDRAEQARVAVDELMGLGRRYGLSWAWGWAHLLMGQLHLEQGAVVEGIAELDHAARQFAAQHQRPFEVGATAMGALGCLLIGDAEGAQARLDRGLELREQVRSSWSLLLLNTLLAERLVRAGEQEQAERVLEDSRALCGAGGSPLAAVMMCCGQGFIALGALRVARARGFTRAASAQRSTLLGLLRAMRGEQARLMGMSVELRLMRRLLLRSLPGELSGARLESELEDTAQEALLVDWSRAGYRAPGASEWVELEGHALTVALLRALVEQHARAPGEPQRAEELMALLWPGKEVTAQRLYVLISALRRDGLGERLQHEAGGYMLEPGLVVGVVSPA
jgi:tetratricopeptide (TPR) repeat protein